MPTAEERRFMVDRMILAIVLPGVAGAVNASGFLAVGTYTSHISGQVARVGDELAQGHRGQAVGALTLVGLFLAGAIAATAMIEWAKRLAKARYVAPLLVQAGLLAIFAFGAGFRLESGESLPLTGVLCVAMGLQNALVTKISGAVVRTTHMTGIVTDIGIEIVRLWMWWTTGLKKRSAREHVLIVGVLLRGPEWKKLRLHVSILLSFTLGAVAGPNLFLTYGQVAMMAPCFVLLLLAGFDLALGIHGTTDAPVGVPERAR
jgi:uncharacterized membrane protein YoaK (UPF0700 family)